MGHTYGGTRFRRTVPTAEEIAAYQPRIRTTSAERFAASGHHRPDSPTAVVYYVQRSDGAVKIGTSEGLGSRLRSLRSAHGQLDVLATEPGGYHAEARRHDEFAGLALGGEWFRPGEDLLALVAAISRGRS
jgi:hypothetical protein